MVARLFAALFIVCSCCSFSHAELGSWLFVSLIQDRKIVVYQRDAVSGQLMPRGEAKCPAEPGVMCVSPNRKLLFVAFRSTGQLASFGFDDKTGELTPVNAVEGGDDPAYLLVDHSGRYLMCAYYIANKVTVHQIQNDGALGAKPLQTISTAEKAHGIALDSSNRMVFVTHTGANRIFQFRFQPKTGLLTPSAPAFVSAMQGQEPRHIAIHPSDRWVYANNEAGDSISAYEVNKSAATLKQVQTVGTLPAGFDGTRNSTARCEMTADGRFIYVANRGHDSLAGFAIDPETGRVTALGQTPTEKTPRSFTISPDGRFLYAAGQNTGRIATYRILSDGRLDLLRVLNVGPIPWCVLAMDSQEPSE